MADSGGRAGRARQGVRAARRWSLAERAALLGRARLFGQLPAEVLGEIAARVRVASFERGAFVLLEGEPATALGLLAEGRLKIVQETEAGREVILRQIGPGEIFGGAGGLGEPGYLASAVAQEQALVLWLPAADFEALLRSQPEFALAVIRELGARLREASQRIRELQAEQVEQRLARALLRLAERSGAAVPLRRQDLAELAGTTLSTASRTISAWDRQGIVAASRERVTLLRSDLLRAVAEGLPAAPADPLPPA